MKIPSRSWVIWDLVKCVSSDLIGWYELLISEAWLIGEYNETNTEICFFWKNFTVYRDREYIRDPGPTSDVSASIYKEVGSCKFCWMIHENMSWGDWGGPPIAENPKSFFLPTCSFSGLVSPQLFFGADYPRKRGKNWPYSTGILTLFMLIFQLKTLLIRNFVTALHSNFLEIIGCYSAYSWNFLTGSKA